MAITPNWLSDMDTPIRCVHGEILRQPPCRQCQSNHSWNVAGGYEKYEAEKGWDESLGIYRQRNARTPETIKPHAADYNDQSWQLYTLQELGAWVHLLAKRAEHRANPEKRAKDLYDAQNYLTMMQAKLDAMKGEAKP